MAYEFAQHILDQLATATEIFAAGYVGINFVIYSWKRTEAESSLTQPTVIPETTAVTEAPLEVLQPLPLSLPKRELVEISAITSTEAAPIRQLADLNEATRAPEPLPPVNLAPPVIDRVDEIVDDGADIEVDESAIITPTPAPAPTPSADTAKAEPTELEPATPPEVTTTNSVVAEPPTKPEATPASPTSTEPPAETKPVLKKPPVRPVNFGQSTPTNATPQSVQSTDQLTEED